jgi:hypothetical protein
MNSIEIVAFAVFFAFIQQVVSTLLVGVDDFSFARTC